MREFYPSTQLERSCSLLGEQLAEQYGPVNNGGSKTVSPTSGFITRPSVMPSDPPNGPQFAATATEKGGEPTGPTPQLEPAAAYTAG